MSHLMIRDFWANRRLTAGIVERRTLEPICSALQMGSFKQALQNCQKALRIKPNQPTVQALQAIALQHLGQSDQALAVLDQIASDHRNGKSKGLQDADELALCTWIYEQNGRESAAAQLWDETVERNPKNVLLQAEATFYYIQKAEFGMVHKLSKHILELVKSDPVMAKQYPNLGVQCRWFLVMSVHLRLRYAGKRSIKQLDRNPNDSAEGPTSAADLALLDEAIQHILPADPGGDSAMTCSQPAQYHLLLKTLFTSWEKTQQDNEPAAESIRANFLELAFSPAIRQACDRDLFLELYRRECEAKIYRTPSEWKGLSNRMGEKLEQGDTNWLTIKLFIDATFEYAQHPDTEGYEPDDELFRRAGNGQYARWWDANSTAILHPAETSVSVLSAARNLLESLAGGRDAVLPSKVDRGYTLGLLEMAAYEGDRIQSAPLAELVILYLQRYGGKACCFDDLQRHLQLLVDQRSDGLKQLEDHLNQNYTEQAIDVSTLDTSNYALTAEKIRRAIRPSASTAEEEVEQGHRYAQAYFDALPFGQGFAPTDLQPADEWALLAGQAYIQAYSISNDLIYLECAAAILDFAIRRSRYRYHIRVLLIRIYRLLGASSLVMHHHRLLDVRNIQQDTVSHFALERASTFSTLPTEPPKGALVHDPQQGFAEVIGQVTAWYTNADNEITQSIANAWQDQAFTIIESYADLQYKIQNSFTRVSVWVEHLRTLVCKSNLSHEQVQLIAAKHRQVLQLGHKLEDNRDDSILVNLQSLHNKSANIETQTELGPRTQDEWLRPLLSMWADFLTAASITAPSAASEVAEISAPTATFALEQLTSSEKKLVLWARPVARWLAGTAESDQDPDILGLFKDSRADLQAVDLSRPLWEVLHTAALALEAYSLLDTAFSLKSAKEANFKHIKQFRQVRQDAKAQMKGILTRLKALIEDMAKRGKGKNKIEALLPLNRFELMDEAYLLDFAGQLLESRKAALSQLAVTITKRTAGN